MLYMKHEIKISTHEIIQWGVYNREYFNTKSDNWDF